jgi:hypothetical protein
MPKYNSGPRGQILAGIARLVSSLSTPTVNATTGTITTVTATTVNTSVVDASTNLQAPALLLDKTSVKPTARSQPGAVRLVANATTAMLAINTTGTTWKYCNVTTILA